MSPQAGSESNSIGVVLAANGEVFLQSDSGMRSVESGAPVYAGDELITGAGSTAEIRFVDDTLLSQGADSSIALDDYIFDDSADSPSELLFNMSQGTFRMVTGKIAEQNPERFKVGTPLATIGIRGTITVHEIGPGGEKHGVEEIHSGKALLIQSIDGQLRQISSPRALVDIASSGLMSTVRVMSVQEFEQFQSIAPSAIQAEQEIQEQREQEEQQEQQEQEEQQQTDGEEGEGQGEGEGEEGEEGQERAEGGETGGPIIAGEGVLEPGVEGVLAGALEGGEVFQQGFDAEMMELAQETFDALAVGDIETVTELFEKLDEVPTDDDILELIEDANIPEGTEGQTHTSSDGITWVRGSTGNDTLDGTPNSDYIMGLAGNDTIHGDAGADTLYGDAGNDTIVGDEGDDVLGGGAGDDIIRGGEGNDVIGGGSGNDTITGDCGNDTLDGGDGIDDIDFVSFLGAYDSLIASLATGVATYDGPDHAHYTDIMSNFEGIIGSDSCDSLYGDGDANTFIGGGGNDTITGNGGADFASYEDGASAGVTVNLGSGTAIGETGSGTGTDALIGINNIIGSNYADTIYGNGDVNTIIAGGGNDDLKGVGGADVFIVGSGNNRFFYDSAVSSEGGDSITGFVSANDTFKFNSVGGFNIESTFESVASYDGTSAGGAEACFVYVQDDDQLYYDPDGSGATAGILIATIQGDEVVSSDIVVY
ncbi:MAG: hypothetical protein BA863_14290 [Desulfovibrio sp. S3730MH75]|nr:MAG: hypothetical protein BA863_14290 [Desulfovibrio sp. S3730MH75]